MTPPTQPSPDAGAEGRRLLAEWKAAHAIPDRMVPAFCKCGLRRPCPTTRLVAAVEEALEQLGYREDLQEPWHVLAKLAAVRP